MDPEIFGPPLWFILHNMAANYPKTPKKDDRQLMIYFLVGLPSAIPCLTCKNHAMDYLQSKDLSMVVNDKKSLIQFVLDFHNNVNKRLGKKEWTLKQVYSRYGGNL
jgi:hypothetical protein